MLTLTLGPKCCDKESIVKSNFEQVCEHVFRVNPAILNYFLHI